MKNKCLSLALALLLCLGAAACQGGEEESGGPKLAADAQQNRASSAASAEEQQEAQEQALRVVTDLDCYNQAYGYSSGAKQGKRTFQDMIKHFGGTPSGRKAVLEILPMEGGSAYDAELARLRTQIMAGAGPDVFLMSGFGNNTEALPANTLFQSPESAMAKGLFLPLDQYIETARFMEFDQLDQVVMEAGRSGQGQVILPMFYRLAQGNIYPSLPEGVTAPLTWDDAAASELDSVREMTAICLGMQGFREICLGRIADYEKEELLVEEETIRRRAQEALAQYKAAVPLLKNLDNLTVEQILARSESNTPCVLRGQDGTVTAPIETWCAVNVNTQYPEDAFFIVDMLLSREFLSQEAFWTTKEPSGNRAQFMTFFWTAGENLFPVHTGLVSDTKGRYKYTQYPVEYRKAVREARENIGYAYFTSQADRELDRTVSGLAQRLYRGEEVSGAEIDKAIAQCCTTMKMMLAES